MRPDAWTRCLAIRSLIDHLDQAHVGRVVITLASRDPYLPFRVRRARLESHATTIARPFES
jgi:hypothetical protein